MKLEHDESGPASQIAAAIGEPARARILYCLADGCARTSTELAIIAGVMPSTASIHLKILKARRLVKMIPQGKNRYYSLAGEHVAAALEALSVLVGLAGGSRVAFPPQAPPELRLARACYDHIAGRLGVSLHDRFKALGWLSGGMTPAKLYDLTPDGTTAFRSLGIDIENTRNLRCRFAYACMDWSEGKPHLAGSIGAAVLNVALRRRWVVRELDSRALTITRTGEREMLNRFGLRG
jgi:DNA-binding transcriptional ArsR family regulator